MATLTQTLGARSRNLTAEITGWLQENVFSSIYKLVFTLALVGVAVAVFRGQYIAAPALADLVGALWLIGLILVVVGALRHHFDPVGQWLKDRLYNSATSALVTLVIALLLAGAIRGAWNWAVANASFSSDPQEVSARD
ncbi:MAG: hypothetical protein ACRDH2_03770, partial [Anaerolineales bacterium]